MASAPEASVSALVLTWGFEKLVSAKTQYQSWRLTLGDAMPNGGRLTIETPIPFATETYADPHQEQVAS